MAAVADRVRVIWIMVPAGKPVDDVLAALRSHLQAGDLIIDGGNSHFKDSIRRCSDVQKINVHFLDCGTSGGVHGKELGFALMVGGDRAAFAMAAPIFKALAVGGDCGYAYLGPSGAGHYVKMVHNGIEYALLQAYAEGFHLLKDGSYKDLNLEQVCQVWNGGSVVRSWIVELARQVFERDQALTSVGGQIGENKTGQWAVDEAHERCVPVKMIEDALAIRAWSRETGGNYATKVVAMLRHQFGGHAVKQTKK
jgi:6-phosphogluconate dehydrogenase